jgi:tRNA1Val (adenine37-N6)-methyltransferase
MDATISLLSDSGNFFLLLPYKRWTETAASLKHAGLFPVKTVFVKQTTSHHPFRVMVKGGRKEYECSEEFLSIKDDNGQYTGAFTGLLRDYYLYL